MVIRHEWSPIRSVIIRVICLSWVWLQTELDDTKSYYQLITKITIYEKRSIPRYEKGKIYIVSMVIETKVVIGWFKLQLKMWLAYRRALTISQNWPARGNCFLLPEMVSVVAYDYFKYPLWSKLFAWPRKKIVKPLLFHRGICETIKMQ